MEWAIPSPFWWITTTRCLLRLLAILVNCIRARMSAIITLGFSSIAVLLTNRAWMAALARLRKKCAKRTVHSRFVHNRGIQVEVDDGVHPELLAVTERFNLINDAWATTVAGLMPLTDYLDLTARWRQAGLSQSIKAVAAHCAPLAGGEDQHPRPAVAEFQQFHVAMQRRTPPAVIFAIHRNM